MLTKTPAPTAWREDITGWLESLTAAGLSMETIVTRRRKMVFLARNLGKPPTDVTPNDLIRLFASREWKPETRKGYRNTISTFFGWMCMTGRRSDDPSKDVPRVKKPRAHPHPCPDKHILIALSRATEPEKTMLRLAAECGLRRSEICAVHSDDVMDDLGGKSLIVNGKGDKQRIVPLPDDLAVQVEHAHGYLFAGRWRGHVEASYVGRHISRLLPEGWSAHSLRHRYATRTYAATHDLFLVAELLGHESVETTERYVAMPPDRLRSAASAVRLAV